MNKSKCCNAPIYIHTQNDNEWDVCSKCDCQCDITDWSSEDRVIAKLGQIILGGFERRDLWEDLLPKLRQALSDYKKEVIGKPYCDCEDEDMTGHTSSLCCNICGKPLKGEWNAQ